MITKIYDLNHQVFSGQDNISFYIDGTHDSSNWMKYVKSAISEEVQNMSIIQQGEDIYYETNKPIHKGI